MKTYKRGDLMEIFLDCLPCMLRQTLEASRLATDKSYIQKRIMEDCIEILSYFENYKCSPSLCKEMHGAVKKHTSIKDPYAQVKSRDINAAKQIIPALKSFLQKKQNSLYWALKIAATGNIIDSAVNNNENMLESIEKELNRDFAVCDIDLFEGKLKTAKNILIIGDNAGETVFDRVLAEQLSSFNITFAARNEPIINDATIEDAYASGLGDFTNIISTGCSAPGAILEDCSAEFLDFFEKADVIISKGQGNFEALSDCNKPIFYLLKAKCPMIAEKFGVRLNDYVFKCYKTC